MTMERFTTGDFIARLPLRSEADQDRDEPSRRPRRARPTPCGKRLPPVPSSIRSTPDPDDQYLRKISRQGGGFTTLHVAEREGSKISKPAFASRASPSRRPS